LRNLSSSPVFLLLRLTNDVRLFFCGVFSPSAASPPTLSNVHPRALMPLRFWLPITLFSGFLFPSDLLFFFLFSFSTFLLGGPWLRLCILVGFPSPFDALFPLTFFFPRLFLSLASYFFDEGSFFPTNGSFFFLPPGTGAALIALFFWHPAQILLIPFFFFLRSCKLRKQGGNLFPPPSVRMTTVFFL